MSVGEQAQRGRARLDQLAQLLDELVGHADVDQLGRQRAGAGADAAGDEHAHRAAQDQSEQPAPQAGAERG